MKRTLISETINCVGQEVTVSGWANVVRAHGKILFVDLRDRTGLLQVVFLPQEADTYEKVKSIRPEWVISITGNIVSRPEKMVNDKIVTGKVELVAKTLEVLAEAKTSPFDIGTAGYEVDEEKRLQYRYLDLRRERMQRNLRKRHIFIQAMRDFLTREEFCEIETPYLTKSTPEGARDFVVPSRLQPGNFYALPQSPQQYKQLLQVGGIEKYFQVARCFRDEDPRADRQAEFTQLDLEMSFVEQEDIMEVNERMVIETVQKLFPEKKIQQIPFPRLDYKDVMQKYGTDRPDIREDKNDPNLLAFCWVINFPFFEKADNGGWTFTHNPFSAPKPEFVSDLMAKKNVGDIITTQYDIVLNGAEIGGGSIRNHKPEALEAVFEIMGYEKERIYNNFGHILEAFRYGTPPHGGIAYGFDRFISILLGEPNIREVMAFPKTGDSRDPMMSAPSKIDAKQLKELKIEVQGDKKKVLGVKKKVSASGSKPRKKK